MVVALALLWAAPARADAIRITSGAWTWTGPAAGGDMTLNGESFTASARTGALGVFWPYMLCFNPECRPGTTVRLDAGWFGLDVSGTVVINGTTVRVGSLDPTFGTLNTQWFGNLTIPSSFTGGSLAAPFTFGGEFIYPLAPTPSRYSLFGTGMATLTFAPYQAYPGALLLTGASYAFDDVAPTPEPASMLLIGTGLAGVVIAHRRRRTDGRRIDG
jgi:hypothetical protein